MHHRKSDGESAPPAARLQDQLTSALVRELDSVGRNHGLSPLDWTIQTAPDDVVVQGVPSGAESDPDALCAAWAEKLEMAEYAFDLGFGTRSWYRDDGIWHVEICTAP
jgi:hypothetical protein